MEYHLNGAQLCWYISSVSRVHIAMYHFEVSFRTRFTQQLLYPTVFGFQSQHVSGISPSRWASAERRPLHPHHWFRSVWPACSGPAWTCFLWHTELCHLPSPSWLPQPVHDLRQVLSGRHSGTASGRGWSSSRCRSRWCQPAPSRRWPRCSWWSSSTGSFTSWWCCPSPAGSRSRWPCGSASTASSLSQCKASFELWFSQLHSALLDLHISQCRVIAVQSLSVCSPCAKHQGVFESRKNLMPSLCLFPYFYFTRNCNP